MPQKFGDIAKKIKNLFKKRYDYDYSLDIINKSKDGMTMSTGFAMEDQDVLSGSVKMEYEDPKLGQFDVNLKVKGKEEDEKTQLCCKFDKLFDGLELNVKCNVKPDMTFTADYEQDAFAVQAELASDIAFENTTLSGNGAFTYNDFSVGLSGELDLIHQEPKNYDAALQYKQNPHIVSVVTKKKFSEFLVGYHASPRDDLEAGIQIEVTDEEKDQEYKVIGKFGLDYMIDPTTSFRSKFDTEYTLSYAIQHELSNPALRVNFCHEISPFSGFETRNWGFGLTVGDYGSK